MKYLLDTNVIIEILRGNNSIIEKVEDVGQNECVISEITIAELLYGAVRGNKAKNFEDIVRVEQEFAILPIRPAYREYTEIRNELRNQGQVIDHMDMFVASVAKSNGLVLVTHNTKHFLRIEGLAIEDWQK